MKREPKSIFLSVCLALLPFFGEAQTNDLGTRLKETLAGNAATVGVAVIFNGNELVTVNNMYRYPMMDVFEFHQALSVLDYINRGKKDLATEVLVKQSRLSADGHSPMRDSNPEGNFTMSVGDLLKYTLIDGDDNACDILFDLIGGPGATEKYLRKLGIADVAISQTEAMMRADPGNCMQNWCKPSSAVLLLETFLQQPLCDKSQKQFIQRAMAECSSGKDMLKAGLPGDVLLAHRTGSSSRNEYGYKTADNDMGFVVFPDGQYYTIAVFVMNSRETDKKNARIIADVSRIVYEYFVAHYKK